MLSFWLSVDGSELQESDLLGGEWEFEAERFDWAAGVERPNEHGGGFRELSMAIAFQLDEGDSDLNDVVQGALTSQGDWTRFI
jgi:hypothetical protein